MIKKLMKIRPLCLLALVTIVSTSPAPVIIEDPALASFIFQLDFSGKLTGFFMETSEIGSESEIIESLVVGPGGQQVTRKVPGRVKYSNITLKRGITANMDVWIWRKMVEDGDVDGARTNGSIIMLNQEGQEVARWNLVNVWPSKVVANGVDGLVVEEITLCCESIERVL